MTTLKDILLSPENRPRVIRDAEQLVDSEVNAKSGLSGIAIKAGFKVVKGIKPGLIPEAIDTLLDRFVERLEPFHAEWLQANKSPGFEAFLSSRKSKVANALLGVTDDRARQVKNQTIKKTYESLRPKGEEHVSAAVPGLGRILSRYLG